MGLDMYLTASKCISGGEFADEKEKKQCGDVMKAFGLDVSKSQSRAVTVSLNIAYWRKAKQVHAWFVREVQGGENDCNRYEVSRAQLVSLLTLCKEALANRESAAAILPTSSGFFFGCTEYGDYYFSDLESTVEQIGSILNNSIFEEEGWNFKYRSSW